MGIDPRIEEAYNALRDRGVSHEDAMQQIATMLNGPQGQPGGAPAQPSPKMQEAYNKLRDGGVSHEEAVERVARIVENPSTTPQPGMPVGSDIGVRVPGLGYVSAGGALDALVAYGSGLSLGVPGMVDEDIAAQTSEIAERSPGGWAASQVAAGLTGATLAAGSALVPKPGAMMLRGSGGRFISPNVGGLVRHPIQTAGAVGRQVLQPAGRAATRNLRIAGHEIAGSPIWHLLRRTVGATAKYGTGPAVTYWALRKALSGSGGMSDYSAGAR